MADRFYRTKADADEVQNALIFCAGVPLTTALEAGVTLRDVVEALRDSFAWEAWPQDRVTRQQAARLILSHFKEASDE